MQVAQINNSSNIGSDSGAAGQVDEAGRARTADSAGATQAAPASATVIARTPLRHGVARWDAPLQGEISSAQQTLAFLDQSVSELQNLKSELSAKLAAQQQRGDGQLEARVRQFGHTWRQRQQATGGALDGQLNYSGGAPGRQNFAVRGLSLASLRDGPKETLAISVGGAQPAVVSVGLEEGMADREIVQRFDQALTPANIRVGAGADGALVFSTPEGNYAALRDTLAIKGGGIRFPDGQMSRVKTDAQAPAVAPEQWRADDADSLRATLHHVVRALSRVQQARANVSAALAAAAGKVAAAQPGDEAGVDQIARNFVELGTSPGYQALVSLSAALVGINRERVLSLLSLR